MNRDFYLSGIPHNNKETNNELMQEKMQEEEEKPLVISRCFHSTHTGSILLKVVPLVN